MDLDKILKDNGTMEFIYKGKRYLIACYWIKKKLKKGHAEYWLMEFLNGEQHRRIFNTIEDLLKANIEGKSLKSILDSIKIID